MAHNTDSDRSGSRPEDRPEGESTLRQTEGNSRPLDGLRREVMLNGGVVIKDHGDLYGVYFAGKLRVLRAEWNDAYADGKALKARVSEGASRERA